MTGVEQLHAARMIHVADVQPGDLIDTEGWWGADSVEALAAEDELAEVDCIEAETEDCTLIHFINFPSYGWDVARPIVVQRRLNAVQVPEESA